MKLHASEGQKAMGKSITSKKPLFLSPLLSLKARKLHYYVVCNSLTAVFFHFPFFDEVVGRKLVREQKHSCYCCYQNLISTSYYIWSKRIEKS